MLFTLMAYNVIKIQAMSICVNKGGNRVYQADEVLAVIEEPLAPFDMTT